METLTVTNIFNRLKKHKKPQPPTPDEVWQNPLYFIAFGFGSGAMPVAPGTFGTLMAIPFYLLLSSLSLSTYLIAITLIAIFSAWLCDHISKHIQVHDHPGMCIDEFAGFFVTMINAPLGWAWVLLGFVLFRIFDIFKPGPIRWLDQHIHGGIGMVIDDIAAGLFSMIIIQLIAKVF